MGLLERFQDKLIALKAEGRMRLKHQLEGEKAPVLTEAQVAAGHPKVSVESDFQGLSYGARVSTKFGWLWMSLATAFFVLMLYSVAQGVVRINGRLVTTPEWWHYLQMTAIYVPFLLIGFAFTMARYRVTLTDGQITVRWRIIPFLGWTWSLAVGDQVRVKLAFDGTEINGKPVPAVVMASGGKEISFGSMLKDDVKEYLAGAIQHYYGVPEEVNPSVTPDLPPGPPDLQA
jgi:hypothetical protein